MRGNRKLSNLAHRQSHTKPNALLLRAHSNCTPVRQQSNPRRHDHVHGEARVTAAAARLVSRLALGEKGALERHVAGEDVHVLAPGVDDGVF